MDKHKGTFFGIIVAGIAILISKYTDYEPGELIIFLLSPVLIYCIYLCYRLQVDTRNINIKHNLRDLQTSLDRHRAILEKAGLTDELEKHDEFARNLIQANKNTSDVMHSD